MSALGEPMPLMERLQHLILGGAGDGMQARAPVQSVAVLLPLAYRGGTLRAFRNIVRMLCHGSREAGQGIRVVAAVPSSEASDDFRDLRDLGASIRPYEWRAIDGATLARALGFVRDAPVVPHGYDRAVVPDDGINHMLDCDFWLVVSDRLTEPLAPLRRAGFVVFDYLQRFEPEVLARGADDASFLINVQNAEFVLCSTPFTAQAAVHYAGVRPERVHVVDLAIDVDLELQATGGRPPRTRRPYLLWPTNLGAHKGHLLALDAIERYLAQGGTLDVLCCGVGSSQLDPSTPYAGAEPRVERVRQRVARSRLLRTHVRFLGELGERDYLATVASARFVFHPGRADNGTFAVTEAAWLGVPALCNDYPAMRWMDEQLGLSLAYCDVADESATADALAGMERDAGDRRARLPTHAALRRHGWQCRARSFWATVAPLLNGG